MAKISKEKWKIWGNVFDDFTIKVIQRLIGQRIIDGIESPVKIGKEANVFTATTESGERRIVKIYRLESCNFNKMYSYIRSDPRFMDIKKQRRQVIFSWVKREHKNLLAARKVGVRVPTPIASINHVLVLEFIGHDEPAPQLKDMPPKDQEAFLESIMNNLKLLYQKAGLVHADLSEFNILNMDESAVLIDFSQATTIRDHTADSYLDRDLANLVRFFAKYGLKLEVEELKKKIVTKKATK